jgi:universal stress protein E
MREPKHVLVVLDKPKHPQSALDRAVTLARAAGAHLHLASFCWLPMAARSEVFDTHQRRALRKSVVAERRRWLDGLVLDHGLQAADVSTEVVWTDDIAAWVLSQLEPRAVDLVVKSVHHSRTLLHTPLDWQLLQQLPVPLWLVSTRSRKPTGEVLASVDLTSGDARHRRLNRRVLEGAALAVRLLDGRLSAVTAVEVPGGFEDASYFDPRRMKRQAREQATAGLAAALAEYDVPKRRQHLPLGKVGAAVTEVAERVDADLVVVGTGARRGLGARLLGGSAEKILSRVACDVLAVHL